MNMRLASILIGALVLISAPVFAEPSAEVIESMCFEDAGDMYNIAPKLLMAIAKTESTFRVNIKSSNTNGSVDFCHMQINTFWKKHLKEDWQYLSNPCFCTKVGAWVLSQCIDRYGYTWDAVACYNTGQSTKIKNKVKRKKALQYVAKVKNALSTLEEDL
jgi:soluble lytic murein transglycosylase-like protein